MSSKSAILAVRIIGDAAGGKQALDDTSGAAEGLFGKLKGGVGIAAGIGAAFVTAGVVAAKGLYDVGAQWDDVKDTIRVGTGAVGESLDGLIDSAKNVATSIPAAIEDIGPVIADVNTRMGLTGGTLETVASQYLEAGRILGETVDINKTSAAFGVFKIEGAAVEGALDSMFQVSQATGVGMNDLADKVAKAGPALQGLGFGFEDTIALTGSLDKAGLDASATLGAMGKGLVTLARAGEEPAAAFQRVSGEIQGFVDNGDKAAALDLASQLFGTRGAAQFVGAIESGVLATEDLFAATGATTDTILGLGAETADAAEKWQLLKNKALVALEPLGSAIFDGVGAALDWLLGAVDGFDWTPLQTGLDAVTGTISGFEGILEGLSLWLTGTLAPAVGGFVESFRGYWDMAVAIVTDFVAGVTANIEPLIPTVTGILATVGEIIVTGATLAGEVIARVTAGIQAAWEIIGPPIINVVGTIFSTVVGIIGPAVDIIKAIIDTGLALIRGNWSGAWDGIKGIVSGVWELIKGIVGGAIDVVKAVISGAIEVIKGVWQTGWDAIKGTLSTAWDNIKTATSTGIGNVKQFFKDLPGQIGGYLASLPDKLYNAGRDLVQGLINGIKDMGGRVAGAIGDVVNSGINKAKSLLGIASPSKLFRQFGRWTGMGLEGGILDRVQAVAAAGRKLAGAVVPDTMPEFPVPDLAGLPAAGRGAGRGAGVTININGALDPLAVARQVRDLLTRDARIRGAIDINGVVLP